VTKDSSLADAIERGRALLGSEAPEATLVRDLAIHGARLEQDRRRVALSELADHDWLDNVLESDALAAAGSDDLPVAQ